ncbi:MAG: hypothetical protein ABH875_02870 [Candidatus Omnitrophota bacterium]
MSIISDALKKASDQRKPPVRKRDEDLKSIFVSETKRIGSKKREWSVLTGIGTIAIIVAAIAIFIYNSGLFSSSTYSAIPALRPSPEAVAPKEMLVREAVRRVQETPVEVTATETLPLFTLNGIIEGGGESLAMINNTILKKGDLYQGGQVISITKDSVTLFYRDKEITLRIK